MIYDLLIVFSSPFLPIHTYPVLPVSVLSASSAIDFMYRLLITYTLKGLKNAKIEIHNIYLFLMSQFYSDLAKMNINMSAKHALNFMSN